MDVAFLGADEGLAVWGIEDADQLRARFPDPRHLIVKNGGGRVTVFEGTERLDVPALQVQVVEQIGAGDAFAGGYLTGLLRGLDVRQRTRLAHLSAAAALTSHSDHASIVWDDAVQRAIVSSDQEWAGCRSDRQVSRPRWRRWRRPIDQRGNDGGGTMKVGTG